VKGGGFGGIESFREEGVLASGKMTKFGIGKRGEEEWKTQLLSLKKGGGRFFLEGGEGGCGVTGGGQEPKFSAVVFFQKESCRLKGGGEGRGKIRRGCGKKLRTRICSSKGPS